MPDKIRLNQLNLSIDFVNAFFHVPPLKYEGDRLGHIGFADAFFWMIEGEMFLMIEDKSYIVSKGQLAFLPKKKMRTYTPSTDNCVIYELTFSASIDGKNIMEHFGIDFETAKETFIVDIPNGDELTRIFERATRFGYYQEPFVTIELYSTLLNVIYFYLRNYKQTNLEDKILFAPILTYMDQHLTEDITVNDLCKMVHMQSAYFVTRFKNAFKYPPITYLNNLRLYHAMTYLLRDNTSVDQIAQKTGFKDNSYFTRKFKKFTGLTPTEYRKLFNSKRYIND